MIGPAAEKRPELETLWEGQFPRFLTVFATVFVIVDPVGVVPIFISLTQGYSGAQKRRVLLRAAVFGSLLLMTFALLGEQLFKFLNLNMDAFRVGGGILLLITAIEMLRGRGSSFKHSSDERITEDQKIGISFVPLGIPHLVGPGAITSVMVFSSGHTEHRFIQFLVVSAAVVCVFFLAYWILRASDFFSRVLGPSGISVVERLMGLLLAALSIQFIAEGASKLWRLYGG